MEAEGLGYLDWASNAAANEYITSGGRLGAVVAAVKKEKGGRCWLLLLQPLELKPRGFSLHEHRRCWMCALDARLQARRRRCLLFACFPRPVPAAWLR